MANKIIFLILIAILSYSQEITAGLQRTDATISIGANIPKSQIQYYLSGSAEMYISDKASLIGEAFLHVGNLNDTTADIRNMQLNHFISVGGNYHFVKRKNDLSVGFLPSLVLFDGSLFPATSINFSYYYYLHKYFHFFVRNKLMYFYTTENNIIYVLSVGLGFNINKNNFLRN